MVRTPLRSPTTDGAVSPTFSPPRPPLVSWRFSSSLCKLPSPSPQITVFSKRAQNVMRSLHHHGSQIPISFFADLLLWLALPGDFLHPDLVFLDALVQRFDLSKQRLQNLAQLRTQLSGQLPAYLLRATLGQPLAIRLHQPAGGVHQGCSSTYQFGSRPDHRQVNLRLRTAMPHRPQQRRIDSRQPCQGPRIVSIIFSIALGNQLHFLCVRHDHFVSQLR
jgi:hypothetical protein